MTNSAGVATCNITPGEKAASYPLTATFAGYSPPDPTTALQLLSTSATSTFNVTLEETAIAYTGPTSVFNGQNLTVSVRCVEQPGGTPIAGRTVSFVLGSGSTAQTCTTNPTTDSTGTASCTIPNVNQTVGPVPLTVTFTSDGYYRTATVTPNINVGPQQVGTTLNVPTATRTTTTPPRCRRRSSTPTPTRARPMSRSRITLTSPYGTQSCTGDDANASGVASCPITPNEPAGTYPSDRGVRRRRHAVAPSRGHHRRRSVRGDPRAGVPDVHRRHRRDQRLVGHPLGRADHRRPRAGNAHQRAGR